MIMGGPRGESTRDAVVESIAFGDRLVLNGAGSFPLAFGQGLAARSADLRDVVIVHPMRREPVSLDPDYVDADPSKVRHVSEFVFDAAVRRGVDAGVVDYRPNHPHEEAATFTLREQEFDVVCAASEPLGDGTVSLGPFGGWILPWLRSPRRRRLLLEVNAHLPQVQGPTRIPLEEATAWYRTDGPISVEAAPAAPSETDRKIAEHVVGLIPPRATMQFGAGGIPSAIAMLLADSGLAGLGLHSEGLFAPMVELIERGVVDNSAKNVHRGRTVCALALGDQSVYDALDDNPDIAMLAIDETNDPRNISRNNRMFSINATMQVDLHGQCSSETLGFRHYSGTGGQWEFTVGATHSAGGRSVIVVPSTARSGTVSTIVPGLPPGSAVTVPRNDVDTVVTEWGVAHLRGRTTTERARQLIAVAHPTFREELTHDARTHGFLP